MTTSEHQHLSRRDCDLLRIGASILVVVTHCLHPWVMDFYTTRSFGSLGFLAMLIDQSIRFTVPIFFFLSGFGIGSQFIKNPPRISTFYRSRLFKIGLPFLIWSVFTSVRHVGYFLELPWSVAPKTAAWKVFKFMFIDGFDYQFYFVIILFQFYLVLPFIYRWMRKGWVIGIVFLIQLIFMTPSDVVLGYFGWTVPVMNSSILILYGFYCCAGIYLAWHRDLLDGLLQRLTGWQVLAIWLVSLSLVVLEFGMNMLRGKSLWDTDHFNRWSVIAYCVASFFLFLKNKEWIRVHVHQNPHWAFLFTGVAPFTFFVYLAHTNILRLVEYLFLGISVWNFISRIAWVVGGTYLLTWLIQWLLKSYPRLRYAVGLPKERLTLADLPGYSFIASRQKPKE